MFRTWTLCEVVKLKVHSFAGICRSAVEESRHYSTETDAQVNNAVNSFDNLANCLGTGNEGSERSFDKRTQRIFHKSDASLSSLARTQECDVSSADKHEYHGKMERAREHQAHFIGCYEAQEKAQRLGREI